MTILKNILSKRSRQEKQEQLINLLLKLTRYPTSVISGIFGSQLPFRAMALSLTKLYHNTYNKFGYTTNVYINSAYKQSKR